MEDAALVARLARDRIALTLCPLSNLRLRIIAELANHPLKRMMDKGLLVTVNSDDPAYFGGYLTQNYRAIGEALSLDREEIATIIRNSWIGSFMADAEKQAALTAYEGALAKLS